MSSTAAAEVSLAELPVKVQVAELLASRYGKDAVIAKRPLDWDQRKAGLDRVKLVSGQTIVLASAGQQSPPQKGWVLMLTGGDAQAGYEWTLYGLPRT